MNAMLQLANELKPFLHFISFYARFYFQQLKRPMHFLLNNDMCYLTWLNQEYMPRFVARIGCEPVFSLQPYTKTARQRRHGPAEHPSPISHTWTVRSGAGLLAVSGATCTHPTAMAGDTCENTAAVAVNLWDPCRQQLQVKRSQQNAMSHQVQTSYIMWRRRELAAGVNKCDQQ